MCPACTIDPMKLPRLLISVVPGVLAVSLLAGCGDGLALDLPTPTATRIPVQPPTAPAVPAAPTPTAVIEQTATETPPTSTPTEVPAGNLQPMAQPTDTPTLEPEPTAQQLVPNPAVATASEAAIEFSPAVLAQGGSAIVYFNEPANAATMTFGGKQYPMLFDGTRWWAIVGVGAFSEPGTAPLTIAYNPADGSPQTQVSGSIDIIYRTYEVENIELDEETSALLDPSVVNNEEALRASIFSGYTTQRLWDGAFQAPSLGGISSTYGIARSYNSGPVSSYHRGTDFIGSDGDPVYAAAAGRVVFAQALQVRGQTVIIDHGVGVFTAYAHLSSIAVSKGEMVTAGQLIGGLGSTGLVTGPHLHWEVIVRGIEVDGELWLAGGVGP